MLNRLFNSTFFFYIGVMSPIIGREYSLEGKFLPALALYIGCIVMIDIGIKKLKEEIKKDGLGNINRNKF